MEGGTNCPICFAEYTSDGSHRVVSLKCGHLFGSDCIEKWISLYKKTYCPTCSVPCRKTHIRPIYAAKVEARDTVKEQEIIEKYIRENELRKSLESEISKLKCQIDIMKASFRQEMARSLNSASNLNTSKIHMKFTKYFKIHFFPEDSLIVFDPVNQCLVISCYRNGSFGVFKYCVSDFEINSFIKFDSKIRDIKMSPFDDGLCLVAFGNEVSIFNVYTESIIRNIDLPSPVSSVSFTWKRDTVLVGDMCGMLYVCNLEDGSLMSLKVCNENIHSIAVTDDTICVSSVFGLYVHTGMSLDSLSFRKEQVDGSGICTGVVSDGRNILGIFREADCSITGIILGEKHVIFRSEMKQLFRHNDRIFNGYVFITDDFKNTIKALDFNSLQPVFTYNFKEPVVSFTGDSNVLIVLTRRGVYLYN